MSKVAMMREALQFLGQRKKYWMIPLFVVLVLFGALLVIAEGSALAPFIYTMF